MQDSICRSMHQLHLKRQEFKIIFQFGMFNSEFPNTIAKKEFILDYDCIGEEEYEPGTILDQFEKYNDAIYELFEQSIGNVLRNLMKGG